MITDTLSQKINEALKAKDAVRVSALRLLSDALHNEWITKQKELTEEEELAVVRRQVKMREEAIEAYEKGGRPEAAEKEQEELKILQEFLPAQMEEVELAQIVEEVIKETGADGPADFGKVMGPLMQKVAGRADGKFVAEVVRQKLSVSS